MNIFISANQMIMIRYFFSVLLLIATAINVSAQNKDLLVGKWLTAGGDAHIQISQTGGKFFGKIAWLREPNDQAGKPKLDDENPNQALRKRPIVGTEILQNFSFSGGDTWEGGTIYDPKTGKTYSCKITASGKDKISVRGFVGISLLGRTETWTRVK